jgi:hypothetical protein
VPFAVQIADTAFGTPARSFYLPRHENSDASVQRAAGVIPAEAGTVRSEASPSVNPPAKKDFITTHPRCIAARTDYVPFALSHFSETPMPEEANGNQARQY